MPALEQLTTSSLGSLLACVMRSTGSPGRGLDTRHRREATTCEKSLESGIRSVGVPLGVDGQIDEMDVARSRLPNFRPLDESRTRRV
jgi:hypothetical protein